MTCLALFALLIFATSAEAWQPHRVVGRVNSIVAANNTVFVADTDDRRPDRLVRVKFGGATVVRVSRRAARPWQWQTRPTVLHEWPVGTFVVVIGHIDRSGAILANRIEIPKPDGSER
ncbi:MAG TPA: hypothetical protein VIE36_15790 [Methylomirabilota bacterium]|jgi:hypothetical protein